jgi:CDP-diacylglycerol--glycerol-3-phosphate 3-phosphatidyltransferase
VTADALTATGIVMAMACSVFIAVGWLQVGLLFVALTGIPDLLDGAVAKAWGNANRRGAFFDSVSDRLTDGLLFGGVAWYFTTTSDGPLPLLPYAVFVSAALVSYIRAKADALGFDGSGGLVERAERFLMLGLGLLFEPLLIPVLIVMLALNLITAGQRFVKVWRQASAPEAPPVTRPRARRSRSSATAAERWRERRAAARTRAQARRGY